MNVGDKVIVDGKETEITATAYDDVGVKVYMVKGSMKDYHLKDFELSDIQRLEAFLDDPMEVYDYNLDEPLENLINKVKEQEKIINLMAEYVDIRRYER